MLQIRKYWREMRGNAFWDAVKVLWVWLYEHLKQLGALALLSAAVALVQKTLYNYYDFIIISIVALGGLLLISLGHKIPRENILGPAHLPQTRAIGLRLSDAMSPCTDPALHELAAEDLRYLSDRVRNLQYKLNKSNPGLAHPWVEFRFTIVNVAVVPVRISDRVTTGRVKCLDEKIPFELEITKGSSSYVNHAAELKVVLRQTLSPEMVAKINATRAIGSEVEFDLSEVVIPLYVATNDSSVGRWVLGKYMLKIGTKF